MLIMWRDEFEEMVLEVVENLPAEFRRELDNVEFIVELWPTEGDLLSVYAHPGVTLFGLYTGVPKPKRGTGYSAVLPDKITIFAGPIIEASTNLEEVRKQIRKTVLHEIGHYFGMSEQSIRNAQKTVLN